MPLGRDHRCHGEGFETGGAVLNAFEIVAEHYEALGDFGERRVGVEMLL